MSEAQLQASVLELARWRGFLAYHTHDSRHSAAGFPDCVLVRGDRVLFCELKSGRGRLRPEQESWLATLRNTPTEVYCWRPDDWASGEIRRILW
jgi:hypothetical protein